MKNFVEIFPSVSAFASAINTRPQREEHPKTDSSDGSLKFTSTPDYDTANGLLVNGDASNLEKIVSVDVRTLSVPNDVKNTLVKCVCGGVPLVPLAIMGVPKNMLAARKTRPGAKVVNIVYNCAFSSDVPAKDIIKAGAKVASLVKSLEARKVRVNLHSCIIAERKKQIVGMVVNVKKAAAPLNMLRIAYPCINPSFLRRSYFRWLETCPIKLNKEFSYACGCPVSIERNETAKEMITAKIGKNLIMIDGEKMIYANVDNVVKDIFAK